MNRSHLLPMLATLGEPPERFADFAVEAKFDGQRGLAVVDRGSVTLLSRNGANVTRTFPEIASGLSALVSHLPVVLDGEIVALDGTGVPSFGRLQRRWPQNRRPSAELLRQVPVRFYVFDVLHLDGSDITRRSYAERRASLIEIAENARSRTIEFPCNWTDVDPGVVLATAADLGLEGIVCKRLDSPYTPGKRSPDWIKTPHRLRSEFVIGGWLPGIGTNRHTIGALPLRAYSDNGRLQFGGVVGTGFTTNHRRILTEQLVPLGRKTSPFTNPVPEDIAPHARWVTPRLVGDVEYREFRGTLRHPSWKGIRPELDSGQVMLPGGPREVVSRLAFRSRRS
jgi:bifunctional non-homologous end joining protein LigD